MHGVDHNDVGQGHKSQLDPRHATPALDEGSHLSVVVETNFKIYAYTTSTLHVAMLSVFVDIVARLPNLAIGFITRESLRSALIHGISAQQIYDFLMKHAHPNMRRNTPVIPENIADQIYLWEVRSLARSPVLMENLTDGGGDADSASATASASSRASCSTGSTRRRTLSRCASTRATSRCSRGRTRSTSSSRSPRQASITCARSSRTSSRLASSSSLLRARIAWKAMRNQQTVAFDEAFEARAQRQSW